MNSNSICALCRVVRISFFNRLWTPLGQGVLFALFASVITNTSIYLIYVQSINAIQQEIRDGLKRKVAALASVLDGDIHQTFNLRQDTSQRREYQDFLATMEKMRIASQDVPYLYTNILRDGEVFFMANGSPQNDADNDGQPDEAPQLMDPYPDASVSLRKALNNGTVEVDAEAYTDQWGSFYSAYAPILDSQGRFVATLGMDLELTTFEKRILPIQTSAQRAAFTSTILSVLLGSAIWLFRGKILGLQDYKNSSDQKIQLIKDNASIESFNQSAQLTEVLNYVDSSHPYLPLLRKYSFLKMGDNEIEDLDNFCFQNWLPSVLPDHVELVFKGFEHSGLVSGPSSQLQSLLKLFLAQYLHSDCLGTLTEVECINHVETLDRLGINLLLAFSHVKNEAELLEVVQNSHSVLHINNPTYLDLAVVLQAFRSLGASISIRFQDQHKAHLVLSFDFQKYVET